MLHSDNFLKLPCVTLLSAEPGMLICLIGKGKKRRIYILLNRSGGKQHPPLPLYQKS